MKSNKTCAIAFSLLGLALLLGCGGTGTNPLLPTQQATSPTPSVPQSLSMWNSNFSFAGFNFPFSMVGTNPVVGGAGTTNVPVIIIPLNVGFGATVLSPLANACGDTASVLSRVQDSPMFTSNTTWIMGGINVGTTQFPDAFQRANFWSSVSTISPNYHVLLSPVDTQSALTINVAPGFGQILPNSSSNPACLQQAVGGVSLNFLDAAVRNALASSRIPANVLPIFLTYDVAFLDASGSPALGYHSTLPDGHTYIVASYVDRGLFSFNVDDVTIISHELGEWVDNPVLSNFVPPWGHLGSVIGCDNRLEVGDGVIQTIASVQTTGFTYHVQDLTFFSWFARETPSRGVNGWYSTLNSLSSPQPICQ